MPTPPVPFSYGGPAPAPGPPPATNRITDTQDKRFQAMLRAKNLTLEDVFWLVCGDKCPTCEVTRPMKDHLTRVAKLEAFAKNVVDDRDHELNSPESSDCDGPLHCIRCAAEEALK